ncbi:hypothetical protein P691DRAFT_356830 [Macrolepiota fuliginosa MF-IS2]|uniref:Uncharacterized protein n=1 Tax=Macrolepiota fuliginosa MF-IS2 TaxID=1400762 RepID=A0A9P6C045_9AGAR|nr:hypothetical protein P691DRAFT_356830 [Macrolepiota fuliginosa MF-IS2]
MTLIRSSCLHGQTRGGGKKSQNPLGGCSGEFGAHFGGYQASCSIRLLPSLRGCSLHAAEGQLSEQNSSTRENGSDWHGRKSPVLGPCPNTTYQRINIHHSRPWRCFDTSCAQALCSY